MNAAKLHVKELTVEEIMIPTKDVLTVNMGETMKAVMELFVSKNISGAPVVDQSNRVISIISEKDLLRFGAMNELATTVGSQLAKLPNRKDLIAVKRTDPFREVFKDFLLNPVKRVLVLDDSDHLQGIVTRSNLLKAFLDIDKAKQQQPAKDPKSPT